MKIGLFVDKGRELMGLSMKWGGFMDGMGIFEQKNEERRVGLRGKIFENVE